MHLRDPAADALHTHLLRALDWVQRTGWSTRDDDTTLTMQVFDAWCASTPPPTGSTDPEHHDVLVEALQAAFVSRYGDKVLARA